MAHQGFRPAVVVRIYILPCIPSLRDSSSDHMCEEGGPWLSFHFI
jgi:hypothetical protein